MFIWSGIMCLNQMDQQWVVREWYSGKMLTSWVGFVGCQKQSLKSIDFS